MVGHTSRDRNGNWRGGRVVTADGYVMIRVGKTHHLADCRGYAYEHRMVAECNLGRDLLPGEEVHHRDEDARDNNDWSNLIVCASKLEHLQKHRTSTLPSRAVRVHGEDNPVVSCLCGCGGTFERYDAVRRERRYLPNHNSRKIAHG